MINIPFNNSFPPLPPSLHFCYVKCTMVVNNQEPVWCTGYGIDHKKVSNSKLVKFEIKGMRNEDNSSFVTTIHYTYLKFSMYVNHSYCYYISLSLPLFLCLTIPSVPFGEYLALQAVK